MRVFLSSFKGEKQSYGFVVKNALLRMEKIGAELRGENSMPLRYKPPIYRAKLTPGW